jgi:hypothetical protein
MRHDCRGDTWADIERFGNDRLARLRTFLRLEGGVPSHDTFGRVFALLDPAELVACIQQWLDDLGREIGKNVAIDGKTLRGSGDKAAGRNPLAHGSPNDRRVWYVRPRRHIRAICQYITSS